MSGINLQNQYDEQDQQANQQENGTGCNCLNCCCKYVEWSMKAFCQMCKCIVDCDRMW